MLGCLLYVVNWVFIFTQQSYVALFTSPSPVQHFWSLAVEEQFYLLMPVGPVVAAAPHPVAEAPSGSCSAASRCCPPPSSSCSTRPAAGFDRVYYGTDTRASEILVGVVLAVVLTRHPIPPGIVARPGLAVARAGRHGRHHLVLGQRADHELVHVARRDLPVLDGLDRRSS